MRLLVAVLTAEGVSSGGLQQLLATVNRWVGAALIALGLLFVSFGTYFGAFAWLNDGAKVGLRFLAVVGSWGLGLALSGFGFRFAASAHARRDRHRWWIQVLAVLVAYCAVGFAGWVSSS